MSVTVVSYVIQYQIPTYCLMVLDRAIPLETQSLADRLVIVISLFVVCKPCGQMRCDEAKTCILDFEADGNGTFVAGHPTHAGLSACQLMSISDWGYNHLLQARLNILDLVKQSSTNEDRQGRSHKLATS